MKKQQIQQFFLIILISVSIQISAQKTKAEITFNDGTTITGLGKLKGEKFLKFRKSRKSKPKNYHFSKIKRVKIHEKKQVRSYVYLKIKDIKKPKVVEELCVGEVSLYRMYSVGGAPGMFGIPGASGVGSSSSFTAKDYFVRRSDQSEATHLGSNLLITKNFKKTTSKFFEDCPALVQKIKDRTYKKKDLVKIVKYYNTKCSPK